MEDQQEWDDDRARNITRHKKKVEGVRCGMQGVGGGGLEWW